ncbi:hypothetical protein AX15_006129 [Amanita polypyramis BW_CC]|nr:hypothetical protein AX15_006129 [Amanita polypyramis BW_CC]
MDFQHTHNTDIFCLKTCPFDDGRDLIAIGGDYGVDILTVGSSECRVVASFHIGARVTALAWSSKSVSPNIGSEWVLELAAASSDYGLYLLAKTSVSEEFMFKFGGELTGHHGKINDMAFCGGRGKNSMRYVGSVSDDKMLMVWDLYPDNPAQPLEGRPQPTAYAIPFPHPLSSIDSHASSDKEFLVADRRGFVYISDWRSDPENAVELDSCNCNVVELVNPSALLSVGGSCSSAAWRPDNADIIGAVCGTQFAVWDLRNSQGGRPFRNGISFPDGGHYFRWCPTYPEYFAIASKTPNQGATIHVYNLNYINAQPSVFNMAPRPHAVDAMDFVYLHGIPYVAAAVGRKLVIFHIGIGK